MNESSSLPEEPTAPAAGPDATTETPEPLAEAAGAAHGADEVAVATAEAAGTADTAEETDTSVLGHKHPEQQEMPFAIVQGTPVHELPRDLYIPPDALEVFLEAFEGPLDLLLYLIKRQNLDVLDIPIARITEQYMGYIGMMTNMKLELAAEYLLMAAMLAEIKSRMLLPRPEAQGEEDEGDPRAELVRRLQEYERFKAVAEAIDELPRMERDMRPVQVAFDHRHRTVPPPEVSLQQIMDAFHDVVVRAMNNADHNVTREPLSVRERMGIVLDRLVPGQYIEFQQCFSREEGRAGVIVTVIAILELTKQAVIELVQNEINGPIYLKAAA